MGSRARSLLMTGSAALLHAGIASTAMAQATTTYHPDRGTPRLQILPSEQVRSQANLAPSATARAQEMPDKLQAAWRFLSEHATEYGLSPDLSSLEHVATQATKAGTTFRFKQRLGGYKVEGGEIIVAVNDQNQIYQVYNNIYPVAPDKVARATEGKINQDQAIGLAWNTLGAQGFVEEPQAELKYVPLNGTFVLAYDVRLYVDRKKTDGASRPGLWQVIVDAVSGKVIGQPTELSINEGKRADDETYIDQAADLAASLRALAADGARRVPPLAAAEAVERVPGTALVFDSDPVTTLKDGSLRDDSPPNKFDPAYTEAALLDLAKASGTVRLDGPWVNIVDFERPATAPSTTSDGTWRAKRGDNAFNDVMTYYHIDKSQRYIQALGFPGIQARSIPADSDGFNGTDNSHYVPAPFDRIAFGHGCVDDNEDVDVILHEYGHAITHAINPSWGGGNGDSGAIGEGFGDYWAETYSHTTVNGAMFQAEKVFDWDGIDTCWGGRRLNITGVKYNPSRRYGAHQSIGGGVQSDELWSTPLYQSFLQLRGRNVPREEVDTIVLESMFNLGSGFTMRDLAVSVVATANRLFPTGPHAGVFEANFRQLEILPVQEEAPPTPQSAGSDVLPTSKQ
jgi:hypothetical protein